MKRKSERRQATVLFGLLLILVIGVVFLGLVTSLPGMKQGADTIAGTITYNEPAFETFAAWKVSGQVLYPNKHALERHGDDATRTTNCYNNNGTFKIYRLRKSNEFHMLCRDVDGSIRDIMLERESETSNRFHSERRCVERSGKVDPAQGCHASIDAKRRGDRD
jgi:hypothetical protein